MILYRCTSMFVLHRNIAEVITEQSRDWLLKSLVTTLGPQYSSIVPNGNHGNGPINAAR